MHIFNTNRYVSLRWNILQKKIWQMNQIFLHDNYMTKIQHIDSIPTHDSAVTL